MQKSLFSFLVCTFLILNIFISMNYGQEFQPFAMKIDEYGSNIDCEVFAARLDAFAIELQNNMESKGYVIIYPGWQLSGRNPPHFTDTRRYLVNSRNIANERIVILRGDIRKELKVELWIVPVGATPPTLEKQVATQEQNSNSAIKFDEGYPVYPFEYEGNEIVGSCTIGSISLKQLAEGLKQQPDTTGYFIVYKGEDASLKTTRRIMSQIRTRMIYKYKFVEKRIKVVYGGRRNYREIEIWIVPKGSVFPKPSPEN